MCIYIYTITYPSKSGLEKNEESFRIGDLHLIEVDQMGHPETWRFPSSCRYPHSSLDGFYSGESQSKIRMRTGGSPS